MIKKMSLISFFTLSFTLFGAENTDSLSPLPLPLTLPSLQDSKAKKGKKSVKFQTGRSFYENLHPEKRTVEERVKDREKARTKQQKLSRGFSTNKFRSIATQKANQDWETSGIFRPIPHDPLLEQQERLEKLQAVTDLLEIESELIAEEMIKKNKPQNEAKITGCFMKTLVLSGEKLGYFVPLIFKKYPAQAALLVDYIVKKLIDETIIDDETLPQKSFIEKIKELSEVGVFEVSTFQDFLKEFLEEYDYSFETAAEASSPSALEDQDSLKQFFEEYQLIFETAAQPWAASVLAEEKRV